MQHALGLLEVPKVHAAPVNVFTVTTGALDASVTLKHYPRWELNAAS